MQTFLPYGPAFQRGAVVLDRQRLVKQAVEGYQILRVHAGLTEGWKNHPAVKMWAGHEGYLVVYLDAILDEMQARGYSTATRDKIHELADQAFPDWQDDEQPPWLRDDRLALSHRGRLFEKRPDLYPQFALDATRFRQYTCCEKCNYFWPTHSQDYGWVNNDGLHKL